MEAGTSAQHQRFQESYNSEKDNTSEKQYSVLPTFSGERLLCQKTLPSIAFPISEICFFTTYFFRKVMLPFHSYTSFLCIYYCSKLRHRWLNKVSWPKKVLWNCYFLMKLLFEKTTFSEPLFFKDPYFSRRSCFLKELIFDTASLIFSVIFSIYHLVINLTNIGVCRLKLPASAPLRKFFY